ncbi:16S rRNA processing protein RimM [Corynebacterium ammoniagenes DSM 20306]|uniref:Ribosome maturation factor RimM n=3 Tax=Corynebacterium ammoniagenes TaxID=1697 RepID=A0AAV5G5B6_CORAM|nr:16S rRNA processing protein RimM [Corynebacterium ammoniagenes DSM 20306]GJN42216.1 ribosome maturation factor RimM [Corynebacterium ammoniagenes]
MLKNMELLIGRVIKSHGIKGEVSVDVTTDSPEERFYPGAVLNGKQGAKDLEFTISTVRAHKGRLLLTFEEITDRTQADSLRGVQFFAPPLEDDDDDDGFYDHELEGLNLVLDGNVIGEVTGISHGPVQSLLEAKLHNGKEALIPFVEEIVPEIDLDEGTCTITPPEGLLEL